MEEILVEATQTIQIKIKTPKESNTSSTPKDSNVNPAPKGNTPGSGPSGPTSAPSGTSPPSAPSSSTPAKSSLLFLILILSYFDINVSENSADLINFLSSILTLEIIVLVGFLNLMLYFISNILILKYDVSTKFPKLEKFINFYVKTSIYFIIFEIVLTLLSILTIIYIYYEFLKIFIFKN